MNNNISNKAIGILISLGIYLLSSITGAFLNVLIMYSAGFDNWKQFTLSGNVAIILVIIIGIANHLFMSWVTVSAMAKYGEKHDCVSQEYFRIAAIAVLVFAVIVVPILFSNASGWVTYISHSIGIEWFGRAKVKKLHTQNASLYSSSGESASFVQPSNQGRSFFQSDNASAPSKTIQDMDSATVYDGKADALYCHMCGAKLLGKSRFCHKCGARIER